MINPEHIEVEECAGCRNLGADCEDHGQCPECDGEQLSKCCGSPIEDNGLCWECKK